MKYDILQFHRESAEVEGGKFGVYYAPTSTCNPFGPANLISTHQTLDDAKAALSRYEASDKRRASR